ncbi:MAG: hypothetical protein IJS42_04700, partial [Synergistaceae bacterium]|nr:hypothetical protein [Synergistaceae bacterium]
GWWLLLQDIGTSEAAQTINGKALGDIDDIVKEVNKGEISLSKKGLITLRGGDKIDDVDVFAATFGKDASYSTRTIIHNLNATRRLDWNGNEPHYLRPAVSRRLYNGKRALMYHNLAPNGEAKYYFKTLSNNRTSHITGTTPKELVDSVQISDFGEYTLPTFSNVYSGFVVQVFGTGVMSVKGYEHEIFVAASGPNNPAQLDKTIRLEFFALNADSEGKMTQEPLTSLTHETPFRGDMKIVSLAVGDFDGDKHNNEVALMINTRNDIYIFVYRLTLSNGNLTLKSLGDSKGIHVYATNQWGNDLESQPVTDMVAGDFDGDGTSEIALLFKISVRAESLKNEKGWPNGPMTGAIHCKIHKWNAEKGVFDTAETAKAYNKEEYIDSAFNTVPSARVAGVIGLRAATADLDGDGKDEIVTLLLGYHHHKAWDSKFNPTCLRIDNFSAYPHLAVWTFNNNSITPVHDDSHVKGGGEGGTEKYKYNFGTLYDLAQDKNKKLLMDDPHLKYTYSWTQGMFGEGGTTRSGINPYDITHMYALTDFSIAAGPFTGTLGTFRTVDDIAVAWKKPGGIDCVTVFKTKVNASKQFDGFEDGKTVIQDNKSGGTWRGLIAADFAGEGVELGTPTHLKKKSNRSYIAALSAIPYHVDTLNTDGTALTTQPVNFTYSDASNGGNMTVTYGKSTTDSKTDTVKQDLSQSVETMFIADPTGTDQKVQGIFGTVKGLTAFASAIGDIANGIKVDNMTPEQRQNAVWKPESSTDGLTDMMDFLTDKVNKTDERTNSQTSTTTIEKNITATTHDSILFTDTERHIWRYPVMTRPIPMWLAWGPRIDSTQVEDPSTVKGDKELYLTFTMSENSPIHTSTSITDSLYQPLHEEGNFFSYPPLIPDVEGYNEAGLLAGENTWEFSNTLDNAGITFTKATSNMQHTETKVEPGGFTQTVSFFDRLINGDKATGIKMPDSDNPKTFSKEYSTSERISYSLQGSSTLTSNMAADHQVKMQAFVAKEGAMTFGTAVQLSSTNYAKLWSGSSIYQQKPDPSLYLPLKFVKDGVNFRANDHDMSAMRIRGVKFYVPDFAFFSDNRLVNGQNYEIRVPLYNASFKDTGNFTVRLSWAETNTLSANKNLIGETTVSLGGWKNDKNNNKGTAIFNWTPNFTLNASSKRNYYLYVEIDPQNNLSEVHEGRYSGSTINDYGGNNTGFYQFYVYNLNDPEVSASGNVIASAADEITLTPLNFTDGDGNTINDMAKYIIDHKDESFVTINANFNYSGSDVPYAFFAGYVLTQSGKQKIPGAGINTIVDLDNLSLNDIDDVFMLQDIALRNGINQVTFTVSPSELIDSASEIIAKADLITFGIQNCTENEIISSSEEFYEGESPDFELDEIPDDIVSDTVTKTYMLTANENVFWLISDEDDVIDDLDITLEAVSGDEFSPSNYGQTAIITVSSIAGYTPKGDYEITVQKSSDGNEWTDAEVLRFNSESAEDEYEYEDDENHSIISRSSSSSGCNAGLGYGTLVFLMIGLVAFRMKSRY